MRELTERDKAIIVDGLPESYLAAYYPALQGRGATLIDRSTNANSGTITNALWYKLPSGLRVLLFDGADDSVNCGKTASLNALTSHITVEAWIKPTTSGQGGFGRVIDKTSFRLFETTNGTIRFTIVVGAANKNASGAAGSVPLHKWAHVAGVYDGANVLLYTNLTLVTGDATLGPIDSHSAYNLTIGNNAASTNCFDGLIAMVRLYRRALTLVELTRHYNRERLLFGV